MVENSLEEIETLKEIRTVKPGDYIQEFIVCSSRYYKVFSKRKDGLLLSTPFGSDDTVERVKKGNRWLASYNFFSGYFHIDIIRKGTEKAKELEKMIKG